MANSLVTWSFPTTIVFGIGAVSTVAEQVRRIGARRALVVCDPGVVKVGIAERVRALLEGSGVAASVFDHVDPNPVEQNVLDGVAAYRAHEAGCVVAVGGGSPLDAGKLIALKVTHDRPLADYDDAADGGGLIRPNLPPPLPLPPPAGARRPLRRPRPLISPPL